LFLMGVPPSKENSGAFPSYSVGQFIWHNFASLFAPQIAQVPCG